MKHEKIYCPYCGPWNGHPEGVEMQAIRAAYRTTWWYKCLECGCESPAKDTREAAYAAAMRRFKPPKRPLEFGELRPGDVVWVEEPGKDPYCVHLVYWRRSGDPETRKPSIQIEKHGLEGSTYFKPDQYGKKWRCWRERPTYDECATAEWEA